MFRKNCKYFCCPYFGATTFSMTSLSITTLQVAIKTHNTHYNETRCRVSHFYFYARCSYAECRDDACCHTECRGARISASLSFKSGKTSNQKKLKNINVFKTRHQPKLSETRLRHKTSSRV
jgi:hypothetical protein